ncbi:reverse transcriptase domain-containing protein [Tanacetum coccineum]
MFGQFMKMNTASTSGSGSLPSNTVANPRGDLKAITTRSGISYDGPPIPPPSSSLPKVVEREPELVECLALADLGASINLMPLSIWKKLSLPELTPTQMILELADRSTTSPSGIAEDVFVKVGKFHFPADFVVVDYVVDPRVPLILGRPFLRMARALIDVYGEELTLRVDDEAITFKVGQTSRYSYNDVVSINQIDVIDVACEEYAQEVLGFSDSSTSDFILEEIEACLTNDSIPLGIDDDDFDPQGDLLLLEKLLNDDPSSPLPLKELHVEELKIVKSSIDDPPELELKDLPSHLEYAFLEGTDKLPVIIAKDLKVDVKDDYKLAIKHQRRVNPKIHEVIKLLDASLIYPISDSPWVSPVYCVPKKGGITVIENDDNELIHTRLVTGWRVCIDYRKLNDATRKDHFPLPFMDQMLERLTGNEYYCFLDGFSGYFQIPIDPQDQEKTTFTCHYGMFSYRCMPFSLCNALGTLQRCMMAIFHDMIEETMEVFMDDFSVFGDSFSSCLSYLDKMLKRCEDTNLVLNWEKCHFMVKEGIVLGHKISKSKIEVDKAKVDVIAKLHHPTSVKGIRSFLGHAGFYRRFIQDFSKIARPMTHLLEKDTPFIFSKECIESFNIQKKKLTKAPILVSYWSQYETYSCELCGNDAHYGYDCPPQVPFVYNQDPCFNQNFDNFPQTSPSFQQQYLCCENCGGPHATFQCQPLNQNFYNSNSFGFDQSQPPQFLVIHQPPQEMSIQDMEDLKQQYLYEMKSLINEFPIKDYRDEKIDIKINELKKNFNGMSIEINKKKKLQQLEQVASPTRFFNSFCYDDDDDDEEYTIAITPDLPTEKPDNSLSMRDKHLDTIPETETNEFIKSSVEDLVSIPTLKDHSDIFIDSNDDYSSNDDDPLYSEDINYVDASPPNSKLVSLEEVKDLDIEDGGIDDDILLIKHDILLEKLLNIHLLIAKIEALKDNPTPSSDDVTKSLSTSPNFFLEETNTFDNSLPESEIFFFDMEEKSSGNPTSHSDLSLPDYEAFYCDSEPDLGDFTMDVVEDIFDNPTREPRVHVPNVLPTHHTLHLDSDFTLSSDSFGSVFDTLLPFSSKNKDNVFNPGILASNEEKSPHLLSHRGFKAFQLISDFSESPMMIYGEDIPILDVSIASDYEASRARGFVLRSLELHILSFILGIQYPKRFNTLAGNLVKKILLKLNLSDHRSILTDSKEYIKMVMERRSVKVKEIQERCISKAFQDYHIKKGMSMSVQKSQVHEMAKSTRWRHEIMFG